MADAVGTATRPLDVGELSDRLAGAVPLSSLYRSLAVLEEVGVVVRHVGADGVARYELGERIAGHHHHIVCVRCGTMADVELDDRTERRLAEVATDVATRAGYTAAGHGLEIEGVCPRCA